MPKMTVYIILIITDINKTPQYYKWVKVDWQKSSLPLDAWIGWSCLEMPNIWETDFRPFFDWMVENDSMEMLNNWETPFCVLQRPDSLRAL